VPVSTAALATVAARERDFFAFLRSELAPAPGRWQATMRIAIACALAITLIMALQVPQGEFLIVTLFVVSQSDAWASVTKAWLRLAGTIAGAALGILSVICFSDKPFLLFPTQGLVVAAALFFNRTTTAPYAFLMTAFTYVLVAPDFITTPGFNLEKGLWRAALVALGALIGTGIQLVLWPAHPESLLLADLAERLARVENILDRLLTASRQSAARTSDAADLVAATGMARQLDLLAGAESLSGWLRQRHTEQVKAIVDVQRIVTAALRLDRGGFDPSRLSPSIRARLATVRAQCARLRRAIAEKRIPAAAETPSWQGGADGAPEGEGASLVAALEEMEESLARLPRLLAFLGTRVEGGRPTALWREPVAQQGLFTPACSPSNYEAIRFALKGALGASICGLLYPAFNQPEVGTCIISCLVVAQATVGGSRRKGALRAAGALAGGLAAIATVVTLIPNMESLAPFLVVCTVLFGVAAWVVSGSARTSYVGMQMAIALSLVLINDLHPSIDLSGVRDRLLGVLLGVAVMWVVDVSLWPVFARAAMRRKLANALSQMAELQRQSSAGSAPGAHSGALATYRTLTEALALQDDLPMEALSHDERGHIREAALRLSSAVQGVFLQVLALHRHRPSLARAAAAAGLEEIGRLDVQVAELLDALAADLETGKAQARSPIVASLVSTSQAPPETTAVYSDLLAELDRLSAAAPRLLPLLRD
jgi:multidrug resistance protein MdtO